MFKIRNRHFKLKDKSNEHYKHLTFCASWALRCLRWSYFSYFYEHKIDIKFKNKGIEAERKVESMLIENNIKFKRGKNRELYFKKFTIIGRADFITPHYVIEVKANKSKFLLQNIAQLNIYMLMEGKKDGLLIFGNGNYIKIKRSDFVLRQVFSYFNELNDCLLNNKMPNPFFYEYCKPCKSCYFNNLCFGSQGGIQYE